MTPEELRREANAAVERSTRESLAKHEAALARAEQQLAYWAKRQAREQHLVDLRRRDLERFASERH